MLKRALTGNWFEKQNYSTPICFDRNRALYDFPLAPQQLAQLRIPLANRCSPAVFLLLIRLLSVLAAQWRPDYSLPSWLLNTVPRRVTDPPKSTTQQPSGRPGPACPPRSPVWSTSSLPVDALVVRYLPGHSWP